MPCLRAVVQVLFEDSSVNRMHESINLFKEVAGNPIFEKTPMFVFLNKKDLFEEMITTKVSEKKKRERHADLDFVQ